MDHLNAMRAFARVIDEGSFAAAARKFNLSPPVMTRLVAELEEHLAARLINRTTRRISLTPAGETYLERVRQILADVEDADAQLSAATTQPRGHLRVVTPPAFAVHQLAKHLPEFRQRYPLVNIVLAAPGPVSTVVAWRFGSITSSGIVSARADSGRAMVAPSTATTAAKCFRLVASQDFDEPLCFMQVSGGCR